MKAESGKISSRSLNVRGNYDTPLTQSSFLKYVDPRDNKETDMIEKNLTNYEANSSGKLLKKEVDNKQVVI